MCGIAGEICFGSQPYIQSKEHLEKYSAPLKFRGPDSSGYRFEQHQSAWISLAHKRLSIIDLDPRSSQPMEYEDCVMVYNGEIYNFQELKAKLISKNIQFNTTSDSEVLLKYYIAFGIKELLAAIEGMFVFVIFDKRKNLAFFGRDRFGKKPLYYHYDAVRKSVLFSSDIRSFYSVSVSLNINMHALGYYFAEMSTPEDTSIFQEIKKLKPAHWAQLDISGFTVQKYWQHTVLNKKSGLNRQDILLQTESLLKDAVKRRMISDVGVSSFLSGGIDSSLITAMLSQNISGKLNTYTIGFNEGSYSELPYARKVAEKYNTNHHEIILTPNDFSKVPEMLEEFGEPFADSSAIPTWYVCNAVAGSEKVVLSGDGGDEIFGGYYEYYHYNRVEKYRHLSSLLPLVKLGQKVIPGNKMSFLRKLLEDAKLPNYQYLIRNGMGFRGDELKMLCDNPDFYSAPENENKKIWNLYTYESAGLMDNIMSASLHTRLVNDYLVKVDRTSMHNSIEVRSPFLDYKLTDFVSGISEDQLLHKGVTKSILKDLGKKYLPVEDIYRKKMGFGIPVNQWFGKDLKGEFASLIEHAKRNNNHPLNMEYISKVYNDLISGKSVGHKPWIVYVYLQWIKDKRL